MLLRTDPFRDLDRLTQQMFGTLARPAAMPMDAWRDGSEFVIEFDLPGVDPTTVDLDVERNVLTVKAERPMPEGTPELLVAERPRGVFSRQLILGDNLDTEHVGGRLPRRCADGPDPGDREGQAPQDHDRDTRGPDDGDPRLRRPAIHARGDRNARGAAHPIGVSGSSSCWWIGWVSRGRLPRPRR